MVFYLCNLICQAHIELQEGLTGVQKQTLEGLQEATVKMMTQQAEAVQYTADAAQHIKEVGGKHKMLKRKLFFLTYKLERKYVQSLSCVFSDDRIGTLADYGSSGCHHRGYPFLFLGQAGQA